MRKLLLIPVLLLTFFSTYPAMAGVEGKNPKLLLDALSPDQVKDLNIVVPKETDSGFHVLTIQIYDNKGVQSERHVYFCKNLIGVVSWENSCPDLEPLATKEELQENFEVSQLPKYSPAQESKKNAGVIAAAVVLFLTLGSARRKFAESASATLIGLSADKKVNGIPIKRWGDNSLTWRFPGHRASDNGLSDLSRWLSKRTFILARIVGDGDYGRAMFGSLWTILYYGAAVLGFTAAYQFKFIYAVPAMPYLLGMIAIGTIDALAGLIASWSFLIIIVCYRTPKTVDEVLMLVAFALLCYAPVLIAAATRPFRRFTNNSIERWEKGVDYFLAPAIGMWAAIKLVEGLNGFIGRQFLISYYSLQIGIFVGFLILMRMFAEEFANRVYTWRLDQVKTEYQKQKKLWHSFGFLTEVAIATYFAYRFSDWNKYLAAALALGFLPKLIKLIFDEKLPKSKWIAYTTPKGLFLTIALIYTASTFESYVRGYFETSKEFLLWWIVLASVPAFVFAFIQLFANPTLVLPIQKRPVAKYFWRLGAIVFYLALLATIFGISTTQVSEILSQFNWTDAVNTLKSGIGL